MFPDTLPVYAAGGVTGNALPLKKDTSNRGGTSKALELAANPHSTLVKGLKMVHLKFIEEPAAPFTLFPP